MFKFLKLSVMAAFALSNLCLSVNAAEEQLSQHDQHEKYLSEGVGIDNSVLILKEFSSFHFKLHPANAYIPGDEFWSQVLEKKIKQDFPVFNVVSKEIQETASSQALESSQKLFEKYHPEVVILSLGENDALYGKAIEDIKMYLAAVIQMAKNSDASVIILANQLPIHYGNRYIDEFKNMYTTLASEYEVPVIAQNQQNQQSQQIQSFHQPFFIFHNPFMNPYVDQQKMVDDQLWPEVKKAIKENA